MKKTKKIRKGRKILALMVAVLSMSMGLSFTANATTGAELPNAEISPDGEAWTIIDELPEEDYSARQASFWVPKGTVEVVGEQDLISDQLVEGEHIYQYDREGIIPIHYWYVEWEQTECIHPNPPEYSFHGMSLDVRQICGLNYWSGWAPVCANCGRKIVEAHHYIKRDNISLINEYDLNMSYYYFCPHNRHLEQGFDVRTHVCDNISSNRYKVVYEANCGDYKGTTDPSYHMWCNATHFEGREVTPQTTLNKNNFSREGYVFKGWALEPDGPVVFEDQAEIYNLTDENYEDDGSDKGIVYLYAVWEGSKSTLKVNANGGYYEDTRGEWDEAGTTRTYADMRYNMSLSVLEENLTPPDGFKVFYDEMGGEAVSDVVTKLSFVSWKKEEPFKGRFLDDTYQFIAPNGNVDTLTAVYKNGSVELPLTRREGYNFGGWYLDSAYTKFVGFAGDWYTPSSDVTLYAKWTDLVLYAEPKIDTAYANGKGYAYLTWEQKDNSNKVFRLYRKPAGADESQYVEVISANADGGSIAVNESFDYTGTTKVYNVKYTGFYNMEVYGAQGGNYGDYTGGLGGSVTGRVWLQEGDKLVINIGGQNGHYGGGIGSKYGNGGGMSSVVLVRNGMEVTLFIAGGGGGASVNSNGGAGGSEQGLSNTNWSGKNGMAGGGGGFYGGESGNLVYHNHELLGCVRHVHIGDTEYGGDCYLTTVQEIICGTWESRVNGAACAACYKEQLAAGGNPIETHPGSGAVYVPASEYYIWDYGKVHENRHRHSKEEGFVWLYNAFCPGCRTFSSLDLVGKNHSEIKTVHVLDCTKEWNCGKSTSDIESSTGAYGGSNYIASTVSYYESKAGVKSGNGYIKLTSESIGYLSTYSTNDIKANDLAAPDTIIVDDENVSIKADGKNTVLVKWDISEHKKTKDNGTSYDHLCKSYAVGSEEVMCTSNMTTVEVTTGVKRYYYVYDENPDTVVTASNKQGDLLFASARLNILPGQTNYLHLAAVDQAGNVGGTAHIEVKGEDIEWGVLTDQIHISSVVGGTDRKNVYKDPLSGKIYVKADGATPFMLDYVAKLNGNARDDYQVDHLYFDIKMEGTSYTQEFLTKIPHSDSTVAGSVSIPAGSLLRSVLGSTLMSDAMNSSVTKKNYAVDAYFNQAFSIPASLHGSVLRITPRAGAAYIALDGWEEIMLSDAFDDATHGITIYPDGKAPEFGGTSILESMTEYDRDAGIVINLTATDADSGLKQFYVKVTNIDNYSTQTFVADEAGMVSIPVNGNSSLFYGDVSFELVGVDNVGNVGKVTYGAVNFGLTAHLSKTGVHPRGTGVILYFTTTGYADRAEVVWPAEFDALPNRFDYTSNPEYAKSEAIPFVLPLNGTQDSYDIIVRAYKDGRMIEEVLTIQVAGSILDDVRVRIR